MNLFDPTPHSDLEFLPAGHDLNSLQDLKVAAEYATARRPS